ncbi:MAG: hypothetical protein FWH53_09900 [Leptospirales bacterium]|nr:hypothetical protein [Leptospirales bacterium]
MKLYLPIILFFCISSVSFAATYDASTLHNSVKRSSSVKDLFLDRWDYIEENRYCLDLFGTINWVNNFQIYTTSRQPGQVGLKKPEGMRLVRTYSGIAFLIPLSYDTETDTADFLLGFSTYGYHYGLTKKASIKRGSAGKESVTDYKYTQFFDDIFAASFFWKTYINVHTGVLVNNAIEPKDDGTMSYFGSSSAKKSWFFSSNLLSFMNFNFLMKSSKLETFDISASPTQIYTMFGGELSWYVPEITLGIKRSAIYNDMPFDAVWVKSDKTGSDKQDKANLTLFTLLLEKKFANTLYINYYMAFQCASEKLIEKRTDERLSLRPVKEMRGAIGYDILHNTTSLKLITEAGLCQYWDEAMPFHANSDTYKANGVFGSVDFGFVAFDGLLSVGLKVACSYNDSNELRKLIETTSKTVVQGNFYVALKLYDW